MGLQVDACCMNFTAQNHTFVFEKIRLNPQKPEINMTLTSKSSVCTSMDSTVVLYGIQVDREDDMIKLLYNNEKGHKQTPLLFKGPGLDGDCQDLEKLCRSVKYHFDTIMEHEAGKHFVEEFNSKP